MITITIAHFLLIVIFITNETGVSPTTCQVHLFWGRRITAIKLIMAMKQTKQLTGYQLNRDFLFHCSTDNSIAQEKKIMT